MGEWKDFELQDVECGACGAAAGEPCRPDCIGLASKQDADAAAAEAQQGE